jgi:hypothetical protein
LASALPAPEQTDKVFAISLPVGNWIVFYSFVIDHEIPFAAGGDQAKRAFDAMMGMRKIDVAAIKAARRG